MAHKNHYDCSHQFLFLKIEEYTLLRLHKSYSIPSILEVTKKLTQQYVGPFKVLEKVGRLDYCLDILPNWCIHRVFLLAQLEPASPLSEDPFQPPHLDHLPSAFIEEDTDFSQSFEMERLVNCCIIKRGRETMIQYLVRWVGYVSEVDPWYSFKKLDNTDDLVRKYDAALPK